MSEDAFPWRLVTFDIDGTLTRGHGWAAIAHRTGREEAYRETNARFFAQELGEDEHLRNLFDLATGLTAFEVEDILERTPKLSGIRPAVHSLQARGAQVALLTHNPGYVCDWYRTRYGFNDAEGTPGSEIVDGRVAPPDRVVRAEKEAGLRRLLERLHLRRGATVHVGDGWADARLFPLIGGGVALNSSLAEVRAAADLSLSTTDLRKVAEAIDRLKPRPVVNGGTGLA